jgi:hypothetical protein
MKKHSDFLQSLSEAITHGEFVGSMFPSWRGVAVSKNGVASFARSRSKNGVASLARSRSKNGVASLAYSSSFGRLWLTMTARAVTHR